MLAAMHPDDERLGQLLRAIRRRAGLTQEQLATAAGVPVRDLARLETGHLGALRVTRVRQLFAAAGGQARLTAWWNGARADRLLDERHARLVERVVTILRARGWSTAVELSFSEYGERGSIDVFAARESFRAVAVCEIKSDIGSLEETNRTLDVKERLARTLASRTLGWRPAHVGRLLILPAESSPRRVVAQHSATMDALYPARGREIRQWLRRPHEPLRGLWFLSEPRNPPVVKR